MNAEQGRAEWQVSVDGWSLVPMDGDSVLLLSALGAPVSVISIDWPWALLCLGIYG